MSGLIGWRLSVVLFLLSALTLGVSAIGELTGLCPELSIAPEAFPVGETAEAFLCVTNSSPATIGVLRAGDKFVMTFASGSGSIAAFESAAYVNSATLFSSDFSIRRGTVANQLILQYVGRNKSFSPGDTICVKCSLAIPAVAGSGRIRFEWTVSGQSYPQYNTTLKSSLPISPPGPRDPRGPKDRSGRWGRKGFRALWDRRGRRAFRETRVPLGLRGLKASRAIRDRPDRKGPRDCKAIPVPPALREYRATRDPSAPLVRKDPRD